MASGDSLVSLAYSYRLGHTKVRNSVHMVCAAIEKTMMERFLPRPTQRHGRKWLKASGRSVFFQTAWE